MRRNRVFVSVLIVVILAFTVAPIVIRHAYADHGHGDQLHAFLVVFGSFLTPALAPVLLFKGLVVDYVLPAIGVAHLEGPVTTRVGRWLFTPNYPFDQAKSPPAPDYSRDEFWAFNPTRVVKDAGDLVPPGLEPCKPTEECNTCTAFYLHPTTWYSNNGWNGPALHPITSYLSDDAIGPQQANAFNSMCRVFAPRFRQMSAGAYLQEQGLDDPNSKQALALAFSDVKRAFDFFIKNHHKGEPIFIAGHSQGGLLGELLIRDVFVDKPLSKYLGAGYLVGTTVFDVNFVKGSVKVCQHKDDVECIVSWRTFAKDGDPTAFLHFEPPVPHARRVCTNPLSWENDGGHVPSSHNLGGLQLMHYKTMWRYLIGHKKPRERVAPPEVIPNISDAACVDGNLLVEPLTHYGYGWTWPFPAWTFAAFPGRNYHTYDFNLFFGNIRQNVKDRVLSWYKKARLTPKPVA